MHKYYCNIIQISKDLELDRESRGPYFFKVTGFANPLEE